MVVAAEASDNTRKKFRNMCEYYQVPFYEFGEKTELGNAIGKESGHRWPLRMKILVSTETTDFGMSKERLVVKCQN